MSDRGIEKMSLENQEDPIDNYLNLTYNKLQGMRARAEYFNSNPRSKAEKRLAKDLLAAVSWIEREVKFNDELDRFGLFNVIEKLRREKYGQNRKT